MWHHHFEFLLLGYGAYMTFFDFCKKAFPEITDQTIARMVAGIEAEIFRPDDELRRLARRAVELGVDARVPGGRSARRQSWPSLRRSWAMPGATWLEELETSRDPWFNINVGDGFYHYHRAWNDDLSMPFAGLPGYIAGVKAGESLERPIEQLQAERRQLIEDYRELLGHRRGPRRLRSDDRRWPIACSLMSRGTSSIASTGTRISSSTRSANSAPCSRRTASSPTPRTCSSSPTTSSSRRSSI